MRPSLILTLAILLASMAATALSAADLALVGAKLYPSPTDSPIPNGAVIVHDGRIVAVGPLSATKVPSGATVLDCHGLFVTYGFWNSHVHILTPGLLHARDSAAAGLNQQLDAMFNRWGFTTVFDIASVLDNTLALRSRIRLNELRGPRILTTGEPIWTIPPVYIRDFLTANKIGMPDTSTPAQAAALVRDHAAKGVDGIKLFTGSYQGGANVDVLPLATAKAAVEEARRHALPVFAHPQNLEGVQVAIDSGVDILAHTVPESPPWTPEFAARLKKAGLALIPTLTLFDVELRRSGSSDDDRNAFLAKLAGEVRTYSQAGGEILFGTDIGYIDRYDTGLEFQLMSQAGMTFPQILASLTTSPARRFKAQHSGSLAIGMDADLVVLSADPSLDVTALSKVRYTIRAGSVTYSAQ